MTDRNRVRLSKLSLGAARRARCRARLRAEHVRRCRRPRRRRRRPAGRRRRSDDRPRRIRHRQHGRDRRRRSLHRARPARRRPVHGHRHQGRRRHRQPSRTSTCSLDETSQVDLTARPGSATTLEPSQVDRLGGSAVFSRDKMGAGTTSTREQIEAAAVDQPQHPGLRAPRPARRVHRPRAAARSRPAARTRATTTITRRRRLASDTFGLEAQQPADPAPADLDRRDRGDRRSPSPTTT